MATMTLEARKKAIADALEAADAKGDAERHSIPWKTGTERCTVIEIELDAVLLNHRSHRIRAQLDSHPQSATVSSAPHSEAAQVVLADLLRASMGFDDIKASLQEDGQRDPGVVTRAGVLVNANTRAVALRDLGSSYIRVMVLPDRATEQQISELELRLQVREDLKQEYTFTNTLLFIEECVENRWPVERIAKELGYTALVGKAPGAARVAHRQRMLTLIKEIREASGKRIPYAFFDDKEQALTDMDKAYEALKRSDPSAASRLRSSRIAGILSGMYYRELRHVSPDFGERFLRPELEDANDLRPLLDTIAGARPDEPDGIDILGSGAEDDLGAAVLGWLTSTARDNTVSYAAGGTKITVPREEVVDSIRAAMNAAAEAAKAESNREDLIEQPVKRVKEARQKVRAARDTFRKARTDRRFSGELGTLGYQLRKLSSELEGLVDAVAGESEKDQPPA